jgi:hypothetical protein
VGEYGILIGFLSGPWAEWFKVFVDTPPTVNFFCENVPTTIFTWKRPPDSKQRQGRGRAKARPHFPVFCAGEVSSVF